MNLLFYGTQDDISYLGYLKAAIGGTASCRVITSAVQTIAELEIYCKKAQVNSVITTSTTLLNKLLAKEDARKLPSLDAYAGSLFKRNGIEYVFVQPLQHCVTVPYGSFVLKRYVSKFTKQEQWFPKINFDWEILNASNFDRIFNLYSNATIIAVDIETVKTPLSISCVGYTAIFIDNAGNISSHSCVLPLDSEYHYAILKQMNELPPAKVTQNGKYDNAYFCYYSAPLHNWLWDTATMFHSWYSELPKDLAYLGAFFVREAMYWKDLAHTNDLHEYYLYNCRDTWTTAIVALAWINEAPQWAKDNYVLEFPINLPSHFCEMVGIKRDTGRLEIARNEIQEKITGLQTSLDKSLSFPLNVNSPKQLKKVCQILGLGKKVGNTYFPVESTDEKSLKKFSFLHPLNNWIFSKVLEIRKERKLISTYLPEDDDNDSDGKIFKGRTLYSINPHGTDTGRNASKEHHFWTGLNIQNIPRGKTVKQTFIADEDFLFGECDLEQAESRDVAHISGDEKLIAAVTGPYDFHSLNCSAFFGVPYGDIYDDGTKKVKNKKLRDLAKRVNHGANYCMGSGVLVDTMGLEKIYEAAALLRLPKDWSPIRIAEHLLDCFHKAYPKLQTVMYPAIWSDVLTGNKLTGATGWTRYCFSKPTSENKHARNAYVAHVPQSLNAMVLNKAFWKVFIELQLHPTHSRNFRLLAQIHDSILFQFRQGHEYLCAEVKSRMEIPITVVGYDGITRTFTVPAAIKAGPDGKGSKYWSELE